MFHHYVRVILRYLYSTWFIVCCMFSFPSDLNVSWNSRRNNLIWKYKRKNNNLAPPTGEISRYLFLWPDENRRLWINNECSVPPSAQLRRICCFVISYLLYSMQKIHVISYLFCQKEFWDTLANVDERNAWEQVIYNIEKLNVGN